MPVPTGSEPPRQIVVQFPTPAVEEGRYAAKRCVGDSVTVAADVFRDGHDILRAVVRYRGPKEKRWREAELEPIDEHLDGVRWAGAFELDRPGRWEYTVQAWTDAFATWRDELRRKVAAGQHDLAGELSEGALLLERAAERARSSKDNDEDRRLLEHVLSLLGDPGVPESAKHDAALGPELAAAVARADERHDAVWLPQSLTLWVDRRLAAFGAWYELFPRSWGGLRGVAEQLPKLAELGFDVVYLPPIHPIGHSHRKGPNNSLHAGPDDPGSPWAIGGPEGGHDAVHPDLGTEDDLRALTARAGELGLDVALDFAIQCSPDHPWLREHPQWFKRRPDGSFKYAENPPKRYQDIVNVDWHSKDWRGLWKALRDVVLHWVDCGVKVFRVDNPHTKPFAFWQWLIAELSARDPDVVLLSEAFTRRAVMRHLAKLGFSQSYTYFTWKNARWDLSEYVSELAYSGEQEYFRPNFFVNTPDILHAYLQHGGPPAFVARLVLAATLSPSYGVYSGFEHYEGEAVREGSEEYLDSEKFQLRERRLDGPLLGLIARLNASRRANPALQEFSNVRFLETENEALIGYVKQTGDNAVITVVNLDPQHEQQGLAIVPGDLGLPAAFVAHDLISDERFDWWVGRNFVRLVPGERQAHVLRVEW